MQKPSVPCPNCHSTDTPHTWVAGDGNGKCALCGKRQPDGQPLFQCIDGKIDGLRHELKTLKRMTITHYAWSGQLQIIEGLMQDLKALQLRTFEEPIRQSGSAAEGEPGLVPVHM